MEMNTKGTKLWVLQIYRDIILAAVRLVNFNNRFLFHIICRQTFSYV